MFERHGGPEKTKHHVIGIWNAAPTFKHRRTFVCFPRMKLSIRVSIPVCMSVFRVE